MYLFLTFLLFQVTNCFAQELAHTILFDETLMSISSQYYGTTKCWKELLIRNSTIQSDLKTEVGRTLIIPPPVKCTNSKVKEFSPELVREDNKYTELIPQNRPMMPPLPPLKIKPIKEITNAIAVESQPIEPKPPVVNTPTAKEPAASNAEVVKVLPLVEKKNDDKKAEEKKKELSAKIFLAPFVLKQLNNEKDITYGGSITYKKEKHELAVDYERNIFSSTDSLTKLNVKSGSQHGLATYDINLFWKNFTYFALASYDNAREGAVFITEDRIQFGLFGIKYYFIKYDGHIDDLSLSYIPLFEYLVENVPDHPTSLLNDSYHKVSSQSIRQSFRLRVKTNFFDNNLKIRDIIFYRPAYHLKDSKFDFNDSLFEHAIDFTFKLNKIVDLNYKNTITWDSRAKTVHMLPSTNMINRLSLVLNTSF